MIHNTTIKKLEFKHLKIFIGVHTFITAKQNLHQIENILNLKKNKTQFLFLNGRIRINMKHYKKKRRRWNRYLYFSLINIEQLHIYFYSIPIGIKIKLKKN